MITCLGYKGFWNKIETLTPPNPKLFFSTKSVSRFVVVDVAKLRFGSTEIFGSNCSKLRIGGTYPLSKLWMLKMDSIEPAAPKQCPIFDLFAVIIAYYKFKFFSVPLRRHRAY
jgi:hypothetical protein